jgi:hypothetical protein
MFVRIDESISELKQDGVITGRKIQIFENSGDMFVSGLDSDDFSFITNDVFPMIWLNLTFEVDKLNQKRIDGFAKEFKLCRTINYVEE